jgi:hypothetical protein
MRIQALTAELAVERFDKRIVGWFAWAGEVERDIPLIGPKIEIARDKLAALVDADRLPRKLNRTSVAGENRENVSMMVRTRSFRPVAS